MSSLQRQKLILDEPIKQQLLFTFFYLNFNKKFKA
jgi:hypothetical protein